MGDHDTALVEAKKVYVPWGAILRSFLYKKMDMQKTAEHELLSTNKQTTGVSLSGAWVVPDILIKNTFLHELLTDLSNN